MSTPTNRHNGGPPLDSENPFGRDGWIAVARVMREHHLVGFGRPVEPADPERKFVYSRAEAWIDLIMECRYAAGTIMNGGKKMEIQPGQLLGATSWLSARWNWTPKTVRNFLEKLQSDGMIERSTPGIQYTKTQVHPGSDENYDVHVVGRAKGTQAQIITVCNYSTYQVIRDDEGHAQGHAEGTQGARQGHAKGNTLTKEQGNKETPHTQPGASAHEVHEVDALPIHAPVVQPKPSVPTPPPPPDVARENEEPVGHGVFVNCDTVRHRSFTISIEGIAIQLATSNIGLSTNEARVIARQSAVAHALQWATEINNGKLSRDVVPSSPANYIRGSIVSQRNKAKTNLSKAPSYLQRY